MTHASPSSVHRSVPRLACRIAHRSDLCRCVHDQGQHHGEMFPYRSECHALPGQSSSISRRHHPGEGAFSGRSSFKLSFVRKTESAFSDTCVIRRLAVEWHRFDLLTKNIYSNHCADGNAHGVCALDAHHRHLTVKNKTTVHLSLDHSCTVWLIGHSARNGIVNGRISVVFSRIPSVKFSFQK